MPTAISGLETFTLGSGNDAREERRDEKVDADSFFNLPDSDDTDDEDEDPDDGPSR